MVGVGLTAWWSISTVKSYEDGTNKNYLLKYTQSVAVLNKDVVQGEIITSDMLSDVTINKSTVPNGALSKSGVIGAVAKFNISANVPLTSNMITDNILAADIREQELNTILMPSNLKESDYVDIRLMYTNGTDYIVLAQKQVERIAGQTMWIKLSEDERLLLNGATVDSFLEKGSKLYATIYVDPESQIKKQKSSLTESGTTATGSQDATDITSVLRGYLNKAIQDNMTTLTGGDADATTNTVFDLIVKYQNFANAATRTSENYQPNTSIIDMMKANKNILAQATERLSADARSVMENANNQYENANLDDYNNVVTGAQQSITNQQTQRNNLLNGL
ncbi:SAF domain protein [compost metagenome]